MAVLGQAGSSTVRTAAVLGQVDMGGCQYGNQMSACTRNGNSNDRVLFLQTLGSVVHFKLL